jgi:hypothetical protein
VAEVWPLRVGPPPHLGRPPSLLWVEGSVAGASRARPLWRRHQRPGAGASRARPLWRRHQRLGAGASRARPLWRRHQRPSPAPDFVLFYISTMYSIAKSGSPERPGTTRRRRGPGQAALAATPTPRGRRVPGQAALAATPTPRAGASRARPFWLAAAAPLAGARFCSFLHPYDVFDSKIGLTRGTRDHEAPAPARVAGATLDDLTHSAPHVTPRRLDHGTTASDSFGALGNSPAPRSIAWQGRQAAQPDQA